MDLDKLFESIPYERLYPIAAWQRMAGLLMLSVIAVGGMYAAVISGQETEIATLQQELGEKQKEVQRNEDLALRKEEFIKKIAALNVKLDKAKLQLPTGKEIPRLLEQVSHFGLQSGLEFDIFQPKKEIAKEFYAEVPVRLKVYGRFHNILTFFDQIAHMDRIVTIRNIAMGKKKKKGSNSTIVLTCDAVTYRYIEGSEKASKKDKKKKKGKK